MLKKRIVAILAGLAILAAITGSGIVTDSIGLAGTSPAQACNSSSGSGGGC